MTTTTLDLAAEDAPQDGACCAACAVREAEPVAPTQAPLAVLPRISATPTRDLPIVEAGRPRVAIARDTDRRLTFVGLLVAGGFLAAALLGLAHLVVGRTGLWIPLHLALAGAASTAVASVLPFFTAALAAARPVDPRVRAVGIGGVAGGALVVSVAVPMGATAAAVLGGSVFVTGIGAVAAAALLPLRGALGVRRPLIEVAYAIALAQVSVGVLLAIGMVAGFGPIAERWGLLKPAHAWLNVFGFLAVVIGATLIHLAPTVAGGRIRPRSSARLAVLGLAVGAPLTAVGLVLASDAVVRAGASLEIVGASGLAIHAVAVQGDRGRWTTDLDWHRLTGWSLMLAPGWLLIAVVVAASPLLWLGADPAAWSIGRLAVPLAIGFVGQALIGSWSHLAPAIGPGDQAAHGRQRRMLGRLASQRVFTLNGGAVLASAGALMVIDETAPGTSLAGTPAAGAAFVGIGLVLAGGSMAFSLALLGRATWAGRPTAVATTAF